MSEVINTKAIVLNHLKYSESDLIVTFLTEGHGIVKAIAKGAQKSRKRFPGGFEPFTVLALGITVKESGGLARVDMADVIDPHFPIREDLARIAAGAGFVELASLMELGADESVVAFDLLSRALVLLDNSNDPASISAVFFIKYLDISGFGPPVGECNRCGASLAKTGAIYQGGHGLLCPRCAGGGRGARLSPGTLAFIARAVSLDASRMGRLRLSGAAKDEVYAFLDGYASASVGKRIKALTAGYLAAFS